jgi:hypothetical protein
MLVMITSAENSSWPNDIKIEKFSIAGLKKPCVVRLKVFTIESLAQALSLDFGRGFGVKNLRRMIQFVEVFPSLEIVSTLSRQLAWSRFLEIIYIKDPCAKDFYAEMCRLERWSVRTLRQKNKLDAV